MPKATFKFSQSKNLAAVFENLTSLLRGFVLSLATKSDQQAYANLNAEESFSFNERQIEALILFSTLPKYKHIVSDQSVTTSQSYHQVSNQASLKHDVMIPDETCDDYSSMGRADDLIEHKDLRISKKADSEHLLSILANSVDKTTFTLLNQVHGKLKIDPSASSISSLTSIQLQLCDESEQRDKEMKPFKSYRPILNKSGRLGKYSIESIREIFLACLDKASKQRLDVIYRNFH